MAKASEFLETLRAARQVETVDEALARHREKWLGDLDELRKRIREWLEPIVQAQLAKLADEDFVIEEPDLGTYTCPGLEMTILVGEEPRRVLVRPRGMRVVGIIEQGGRRITGASGRVDLECGVAREILLRFTNVGEVAWRSFSGGEKRELTDEVFFELLKKVTGLASE